MYADTLDCGEERCTWLWRRKMYLVVEKKDVFTPGEKDGLACMWIETYLIASMW